MEYSFERATRQGYDDYYRIRSQNKDLYWTGYAEPPDYRTFFNWYMERLGEADRHIYLIYDHNECLGYLHIDYCDNYAAIGYSVREGWEGRGIATTIVKEAIRLAEQKKESKESLAIITCWINEHNIASIRVVEKCGFRRTKKSEIRRVFAEKRNYFEYSLST